VLIDFEIVQAAETSAGATTASMLIGLPAYIAPERARGGPDIATGVNRVRAEMAEADRTYATGLAALRQAAELTQAELAMAAGRNTPVGPG
jgi:hypothetical protein